jgi:hypothetical protein
MLPNNLSRWNWLAAIAISAAFCAFIVFLLSKADSADDGDWARYLTLFSSVEALGFAAAGMLLGRTIDKPTRDSVEALKSANDALTQSDRNARAAADAIRLDLEDIARGMQAEGVPMSGEETPKTDEGKTARAAIDRAMTRTLTLSPDTPAN